MLGWHWLAWGDGCRPEVLRDELRAHHCLLALAGRLGLHPVAPPSIRHTPRGVVGVLLLAESHAALHTEAEQGLLFVDVFSCATLSSEVARAVVEAHYGPANLHAELTTRGPAAESEG